MLFHKSRVKHTRYDIIMQGKTVMSRRIELVLALTKS